MPSHPTVVPTLAFHPVSPSPRHPDNLSLPLTPPTSIAPQRPPPPTPQINLLTSRTTMLSCTKVPTSYVGLTWKRTKESHESPKPHMAPSKPVGMGPTCRRHAPPPALLSQTRVPWQPPTQRSLAVPGPEFSRPSLLAAHPGRVCPLRLTGR